MASTISTVAPLPASGTYTSSVVPTAGAGAINIIGTVFADQSGTLEIQQSYDQTNWDAQNIISVTPGLGEGFSFKVVAPFLRVAYTNGATAQSVFRLYVDLQDDNGNFVAPQTPTTTGAFLVLREMNGNYQVVGTFDGGTGWDAAATAAVQTNQSGKYAAFDVSLAVVAQETVLKSTEAAAASF